MAGRVLPLILMDLLPGAVGEGAVDSGLPGAKRNSMVMQSTRMSFINEEHKESGR